MYNGLMLYKLFAHSEEYHAGDSSDLEHYLTSWYIALPIFVLVLMAIYYGLQKIGWKFTHVLLLEMVFLLIVGVLFYSLIPIVSIVAITLGMGMALFFSLSSLA